MGISNLPSEFRRFTLNSVQLRRLYSETLKALDDISGSGVIPSGNKFFFLLLRTSESLRPSDDLTPLNSSH